MRRVGLLALMLLGGCGPVEKKEVRQVKSVPVETAMPEIADVPLYFESIGKLYPSVAVEIYSQVEGLLEKIFVVEGQEVFPGTPLVQVDSKVFEIRKREAEAKVEMDKAVLRSAQKKKSRFQILADKDLLAQVEWDELDTEIEKGENALKLDLAKLDTVELEIEHCRICSPLQGKVGKIDIHPGTFLQKMTSLMTISKTEPLMLEFKISEQEYASFQSHAGTIEAKLLCGDATCTGTITFLDNQYDPDTGLRVVRAKIPNAKGKFLAGQSVQVRIATGNLKNQTLIPISAVQHRGQGPYVYIMQPNNSIAIRQLRLGSEVNEKVIVSEGLSPTDEVIIRGHLRLKPSSQVHAVKGIDP